jgi:hypothetical protein
VTPLYIHAVFKLQCTSVYAGPTVYLQTVTPHHGVRTHPGVFLLYLSVTNHDLLPIRFCRAKVADSTRPFSGRPSRLPGS